MVLKDTGWTVWEEMSIMQTLFEIDGYHVVLNYVQNVYPVEKDKFYYEWGFKYTTGIFEFFSYKTKKEAIQIHNAFVKALNAFWEKAQ